MSEITVTDYLINRLEELGVTDFFGLPGDFNFNIVEAIERNKNTNWIGCTNELNAGYAADGYARVNGYGALVTTYGVGELSAINAIAGSFAEYVPVIKIVGIPSTENINKNTILHHNFANPNYHAFENAFSNVVNTTAYLDKDNAKEEIDRVLSVLINYKKPVYIAIPEDICSLKIDSQPDIKRLKSDTTALTSAIDHIKSLLIKSKNPVVIADVLVERFNAKDELLRFLENTKLPVVTLLMGKGLINKDYEGFIGTYLGRYENKETYNYVNNSDCVITIGAIYSDLNTIGFDYNFNPQAMIDIEGTYTVVENVRYDNVLMNDVLLELSTYIQRYRGEYPKREQTYSIENARADELLNASFVYPVIQDFLQENDIIFSETGCIKFGIAPIELPKGANLYNQVLWGSIGWATPAAFGGAIAKRNKRVILITGEGAHQLTAQEISSMMRYDVKPIIIVINNSGYTIERILCKNPMDSFNDIAVWDYSKLPYVFNGDVWSVKARTNKEFVEALRQAEIEQKTRLCYIEIFTDKMDLPDLAKKIMHKKLCKTEV